MGTRLNEAIDRVLREQADTKNLVECLWLMFAATVKIPTGGRQWVEGRRCFFAGAATVFEAMMFRILDPGSEATDADVARLDALSDELSRFSRELAEGLG